MNIYKVKSSSILFTAIIAFILLCSFCGHHDANKQKTIEVATISKVQSAFERISILANQGNDTAQDSLGLMYESGHGVTQNDTIATQWFKKSAEQGNADAQHELGNIYYFSNGVPQDYVMAAQWYLKSAEQGNTDAQFSIGWMYNNGEGVSQDYFTSSQWYLKAAEQSNIYAQYNLGIMYSRGQGVPKDFVQAHYWFNVAATLDKLNKTNAKKKRLKIERLMYPEQINQAQTLAREWIEKHQK